MNIWMSVLTFLSLVNFYLCLVVIFKLLPGISAVFQQILQREQQTLATINKLKMFLKFEENIDVDKPLPFDVKVEPNEKK